MTANARPHRFRFSLRTLFVVLTICGTGGYWLAKQTAYWRASDAYAQAAAAWEADVITTADFCKAAKQLFDAEASMPFADRGKVAAAHLARMEGIRERVNEVIEKGCVRDPMAKQVEIDGYYAEAERLAGKGR